MSAAVDVLIVIVEAHDQAWYDIGQSKLSMRDAISCEQYIGQIGTFLTTYQLLNDSNRLAVIASCDTGAQCLYDDLGVLVDQDASIPTGAAADVVVEGIENILQGNPPTDTPKPELCNHMSAALSKAMCMISRVSSRSNAAAATVSPRVLVIQASADVTSQYIACMNAIFSAQRLHAVIDTVSLTPAATKSTSSFLEQAAHLTGGVHMKLKHPTALLQYLSSCFTASIPTRAMLEMPQPQGIAFKGACFCHARVIDVGFVCSVCLSVFCAPRATCMTCGTEFRRKAAAP